MKNTLLIIYPLLLLISCSSEPLKKYHISEIILESYDSSTRHFDYCYYPPPDTLCKLKSTRKLVTGIVYDSINTDKLKPFFNTDWNIKDEENYIGKYSYKYGENNQLVFSCEYKDGMKDGDFQIYYVGNDWKGGFFQIWGIPNVMDYWSTMYFNKHTCTSSSENFKYLQGWELFRCMSNIKNSNKLLKVKGKYKNGNKIGQWDYYSPNNILTRTEIHDFPEVKYIDYIDHGPYTGEIETIFYQNLLWDPNEWVVGYKNENHSESITLKDGVECISQPYELIEYQRPGNYWVNDRKNGMFTRYFDKEMTKISSQTIYSKIKPPKDFNFHDKSKDYHIRLGYGNPKTYVKVTLNELGDTIENKREEYKFYQSGGILTIQTFINDTLNGIQNKYYENGKNYSELNMKNGVYDSIQKKWFENGNILSEVNYSNGKLNGVSKIWFENGVLQSKMNYENDSIVGLQKVYDEKGNLIVSEYY